MELSKFIVDNKETILRDWEAYAATFVPEFQKHDTVLLRDHVHKMLDAIAADLLNLQSAEQALDKSRGDDDTSSAKKTAAKTHGALRLTAGFSLSQAVSEFRVMRAHITRLWQAALKEESPLMSSVIDDELVRFNEAIDQAVSESVQSYSFERQQEWRIVDSILSSSPDLIFILDLNGTFVYANKALTGLLQRPLDMLTGKNFLDLNISNAEELLLQIQQVISSKEQFHTEMSYTSPSGRWGFYDCIFVPTLNDTGEVEAVSGTARNITERKITEDENWRKANYDLLTGLPNQRLFRDRLEQDVKYAGRVGAPIALLFIDLDRFKETNDLLGHDAGDVLLRLAADRIRGCVRETDTVARLGGDEFTVILHDLKDSQHAEIVAGKIVKEMANSFEISREIVHISASIGIAFSTNDTITPEHLIKNADLAMYEAKNAGSNRFVSSRQN